MTSDDVSKAIIRAGTGLGWQMVPDRPGQVLSSIEFEFFDTHLKKRRASRRIEPQLTVRNGAPYAAGSVEVALRDLYPCDEVVFQAVRETA